VILGNWAFRLPPLEGELLSSCLARNAYAHGTAPQRFLELFWPHEAIWNRDFDRDPAALGRPGRTATGWVAEIAGQLGIPVASVQLATLQDWRGALGGPRLPARGDTPFMLSAGVYHRTRRLHGLQYCPDCLGETPAYYRRAWRLGFVVACGKHGRALSDACQSCSAPIIPHRTLGCLTDCHSCGASLTRVDGEGRVPDGVAQLQHSLAGLLDCVRGAQVGPWATRGAFDGVRALLAVSAARPVQQALRGVLGLAAAPSLPAGQRVRFEQSRTAVRIAALETIAAWTANWPAAFREGARAAHLTQGSFARVQQDKALAAEVSGLPAGFKRRRAAYVPVLDDPALRRLRRRNPSAYRTARAERILSILQRPI